MKIVTIVGARPQFVKAAVVSRELRLVPEITEVFVHTGQHYDPALSDVFFRELDLPAPHYHLGIGSGSHGQQTGAMLSAIDALLQKERPDRVLVYGDTNSTLSGALAAAKLCIPVAHVEAGLRSFNRAMPEEINRVLTDHVADMLFAPTEAAIANLAREGIAGTGVRMVGDVMVDAAVTFAGRANASALLHRLKVKSGEYFLATIHRAENTDDPKRLSAIIEALIAALTFGPVIMPLHPRTRDALQRSGLEACARDKLSLVDPLGFLDMLAAEKNAKAIITDSGGVQKEASWFGVPCLIPRHETEWVELIQTGAARLVKPEEIPALLASTQRGAPAMPDVGAANRVVAALAEDLARCS